MSCEQIMFPFMEVWVGFFQVLHLYQHLECFIAAECSFAPHQSPWRGSNQTQGSESQGELIRTAVAAGILQFGSDADRSLHVLHFGQVSQTTRSLCLC